jgi:hypothetical protein
MDEHSRDEEKQDEVKLPEERVEDLEPADEDSAEVTGGYYAKVSIEYKPQKPDG